MFVDKVTVLAKAGDGGDGAVSFRHEKFVERGGPDGGDGGDGGDIILCASNNQDTLVAFRYNKRLQAQSGQAGSKRKRHGKNGTNLEVKVPVGTVVTNAEGETLADLAQDGACSVIAKGGKGGYGNAHFTSSTRQAPRVAEKGEQGEEYELTLELKMIADVGLVGLPNAGKSTFLSRTSNAHPEIANYPFTTLKPNLGVVDVDNEKSLLVADIPGLIEGASEGKGLGDEFLRHVERTAVLVHLVDVYHEDIAAAYTTIQNELKAYSKDLAKRPQIVAITKIDGVDEEIVEDQRKQLEKVVPKNTRIFAVSATSGENLKPLLYYLLELVAKTRQKRAAKQKDSVPILRFEEPEEAWTIKQLDNGFVVTGAKIERFARRTDFSNPHGVRRLRDIMHKMGILRELERRGVEPGVKITIGAKHLGEIEY